MNGHVRSTVHRWRAAAAMSFAALVVMGSSSVTSAPLGVGRQLTEADLWLAPAAARRDVPNLAEPLADFAARRLDEALRGFTRAVDHLTLGGYARLYVGRTQLALDRFGPAELEARRIIDMQSSGHLGEAALWLFADAAEGAERWSDAKSALEALVDLGSTNPALANVRLGRVALKADDPATAHRAFSKVYYDYPLSPEAAEAGTALRGIATFPAPETRALDLARAQLLFNGRRHADARKAYEALRAGAPAADRDLIALRLAQCDYFLKRYVAARDALRRYLDSSSSSVVEARYYHLSAVRGLGRRAEYVALARDFVRDNPESPLAELALNDLATYYILANEDRTAATVFDEMYRRFPRGTYADRAAWKAGWWAYRAGDHREAARVFESAAVTFRRADYRPSWLYWAGRARAHVRQFEPALEAYRTVVADYRNSYYGRLAARRIDELTPTIGRDVVTAVSGRIRPTRMVGAGAPPPNGRLVEQLLAAGLYDDAVAELRKASGGAGASPFIDATIAYALNRKGELRPAITAMRRAYPEFMAEGGESLPTAILKVIFPLDYWALIRQQATARELDPYLVAALVAQESTFQADVRSAANAWGLMQILPSTGQRVARQIGLRPYSTRALTNPQTNVRLGTTYFADLLEDLGQPAFALAAYNAGPHRVTRWQAERPGLALDEFIDDIPFPETQNYVKRILGTADDYRILYGSSARP